MSTVKQSFCLDQKTVEHLEELATDTKRSMTDLIHEMIEERYKKLKAKKRMEALQRMNNSAPELFANESVQSIKSKALE